MTGRDPAVDAAIKAWRTASHGRHGDLPSSEKVTAMLTGAAREALKPLREAVENPANRLDDVLTGRAYISFDALAPLIYPDDELPTP